MSSYRAKFKEKVQRPTPGIYDLFQQFTHGFPDKIIQDRERQDLHNPKIKTPRKYRYNGENYQTLVPSYTKKGKTIQEHWKNIKQTPYPKGWYNKYRYEIMMGKNYGIYKYDDLPTPYQNKLIRKKLNTAKKRFEHMKDNHWKLYEKTKDPKWRPKAKDLQNFLRNIMKDVPEQLRNKYIKAVWGENFTFTDKQ